MTTPINPTPSQHHGANSTANSRRSSGLGNRSIIFPIAALSLSLRRMLSATPAIAADLDLQPQSHHSKPRLPIPMPSAFSQFSNRPQQQHDCTDFSESLFQLASHFALQVVVCSVPGLSATALHRSRGGCWLLSHIHNAVTPCTTSHAQSTTRRDSHNR